MPLFRLREDDPIATLGELNARPMVQKRPKQLRPAPSQRPAHRHQPHSRRAA